MRELKVDFPALASQTYLNTPVVGLIPKAVLHFKEEQNKLLWKGGSDYWEQTLNMAGEVREKIGEVFRADPAYIALFPAFSYGINAVLEGLKRGAKVLLLKDDYPSITLPVEMRDFRVSYVTADENLEDRIWDAFKTNLPEVFICSMVQYLNGIKIDFTFLKKLKKAFPAVLFIGDGTQYLGTEQFDFENAAFDVMGASAYKWIGAGFGNGFFMFKPGVEDRISPKYKGASSGMGKYKTEESLIGKFEGNHLNMADMGAIKVALEYQEKVGFVIIEKKVKDLSQKAKALLTDLNLLETKVERRKEHSNIFNIKGDDALFEKLTENKIACAQRGEGIRIGLHYYNSEKDLENFLRVVSK